MDFSFLSEVPRPLGLEAETAVVAKEMRKKYPDFFAWVQAGEDKAQDQVDHPHDHAEGQGQVLGVEGRKEEPWLLSNADLEYFYHLTRPLDVGCACPYGWVEKVERVVDQQYPMFGVERFPDLYDKAAHMLWLIIKNEVFSDYNGGVAVLAALVLLERNGITVNTSDKGLCALVVNARSLITDSKNDSDYDDDKAVRYLGAMLRANAGN